MVDIEDPDPQQFPLFSSAERYEADLGPGDVLFIPALWFHNMLGLSDDDNVSVISVNFTLSARLRRGCERVLEGAGGEALRPPGPLRQQGPPAGSQSPPVSGHRHQAPQPAARGVQGLLLQENRPEITRQMLQSRMIADVKNYNDFVLCFASTFQMKIKGFSISSEQNVYTLKFTIGLPFEGERNTSTAPD